MGLGSNEGHTWGMCSGAETGEHLAYKRRSNSVCLKCGTPEAGRAWYS